MTENKVDELITFICTYPEFADIMHVIEFGANKHGDDNWIQQAGKKSSHKDMHASIFRHIAESSAGVREDHETGLDPLLHAAVRCLMLYTRKTRHLDHPEDEA